MTKRFRPVRTQRELEERSIGSSIHPDFRGHQDGKPSIMHAGRIWIVADLPADVFAEYLESARRRLERKRKTS